MRTKLTALILAIASYPVVAQETDASLIERGEYIATAADCAACHGVDFSGGSPIVSPLGSIYASNITPDVATGIGSWTEEEFHNALRRGRSPDKGWLYPAMPYTSFTGINDEDISALHAYIRSVPAVSHDVTATDLPFPFVRPAMIGWNLLNLDVGQATGAKPAESAAAERGRYLVEALGHCSACHTPRDALMGERSDMHLAGAFVGGWQAPNITSDSTGIGDWTNEQIAVFLQTGHNDVAVAGGDMGLAVSRSLSHLSDEDIMDMIAYLRQVPHVETEALAPAPSASAHVDPDTVEEPVTGWQNLAAVGTTDGAVLYQSACASCHGIDGAGGAGPDLGQLRDLRSVHPNNLVQVIAGGIDRNDRVLMPGFGDQMNAEQIAAVASYVRATFGQIDESGPNVSQVEEILSGHAPVSWIIRNAAVLAWTAIAVAILLIGLVIGTRVRRHRLKSIH